MASCWISSALNQSTSSSNCMVESHPSRDIGGVFVGRQREMDALKAALEDALSGRGRLRHRKNPYRRGVGFIRREPRCPGALGLVLRRGRSTPLLALASGYPLLCAGGAHSHDCGLEAGCDYCRAATVHRAESGHAPLRGNSIRTGQSCRISTPSLPGCRTACAPWGTARRCDTPPAG